MKIACVASLGLIAAANGFMPSAPMVGVKSSASVTMSAAPESRRDVLQTVFATAVAAAVVIPELAFADGSISAATVQRAKGIYGGRVLDLQSAVKSGDFAAIKAEKTAFNLLASGGFAQSSKADKVAAKALAKQIIDAADKKDAAALQSAYADLIKLAKIDPVKAGGDTQGYSSDFDWKVRTAKGTIYQR